MLLESLPIVGVLALLVVTVVAFAREWASPDVVALGALTVLILSGLLGGAEVLALFSNSAPVTIGAMFVLSAALERTGVIDLLAKAFIKAAGKSLIKALTLLALTVIPLSACANNTPVVVVFLPILLAFSRSSGVRSSKLLIPLSYFAILGGTVTLIGTSTNILVAGLAVEYGMPAFGMFEITKIGLLYAGIGFVYMLTAGHWLLPDRSTLSSLLSSEDTRSFCSQAVVGANSELAGKVLSQTRLGKERTTTVFEVLREGRRPSGAPIDQLILRAGDVIVFKAHARGVAEIQEMAGTEFDAEEPGPPNGRDVKLVEAIIGPHSTFIGRTIRNLRLRRTYGVVAAALHRRGENLFENFQDIPLAFGDTVIFEGPTENINTLKKEGDFLSLNEAVDRPFKFRRAPVAIAAIVAVMTLSAFNLLPVSSAALVAAVIVVLSGCLSPTEAYRSIEWRLLFLIVGMLGMGKALETTGAAALLAGGVSSALAPYGPVVVLAAVYLIASVLTEFVTNNAVAILMPPIAFGIATSLGVDPRPFFVAIMLAASASFCSPIGYQTNTYVYGAGGYKFSDFARVGIPLNLILWGSAVALIPLMWKF